MTNTTPIDWEAELVALLDELTSVQDELFEALHAKRDCLARRDLEGMAVLDEREGLIRERLEACHFRRQQLLRASRQRNLPGDNLERLAGVAPLSGRDKVGKQIQAASAKMRLLQHECLTNWVVAQRALLHYSQMLEILATGGRIDPTYKERGAVGVAGGTLLNQEA